MPYAGIGRPRTHCSKAYRNRECTLEGHVYGLYDNHVAMLLDEAVYHSEHLRLGARDTDPIDATG